MPFMTGPAREKRRRGRTQTGRNCLLINGLGDGSFKLGCRKANLSSKGKCQILRCLKIGEQLLSVTILCLSKLIDETINETRLRLENEHG